MSFRGSVLFDVDGTLYAYDPHQNERYALLTARFISSALNISDAAANEWMVKEKRAAGSLGAAIRARGWFEQYEERVHAHPDLDPFKYHKRNVALRQMLLSLRTRGWSLGVVTTSPNGPASRFVDRTLGALGISGLFDFVTSATDIATPKPDTRHFLQALTGLGATASTAVFVGDEVEKDLLPAASLGMTTVLVLNGRPRPQRSGAELFLAIERIEDLSTTLAPLEQSRTNAPLVHPIPTWEKAP